jgi:hypothetical protein
LSGRFECEGFVWHKVCPERFVLCDMGFLVRRSGSSRFRYKDAGMNADLQPGILSGHKSRVRQHRRLSADSI